MNRPSSVKKCSLPREARLRLKFQYEAVRAHGASAYGPFFRLSCLIPNQTLSPEFTGEKQHSLPVLSPIFHHVSSRGAAQLDVEKEGDGLQQRLYASYGQRRNPSLTQDLSAFAASAVERDKILSLISTTQCGIIVSKRVGPAVTRNKVKRRLREIYRHARPKLLPGLWLVLIAGQKGSTASFQDLEKEWLRLGNKLSIFISS